MTWIKHSQKHEIHLKKCNGYCRLCSAPREQLETIISGVCLPSLCKIMSNTTKSSTQTQAVVRTPSLPQGGHTRDSNTNLTACLWAVHISSYLCRGAVHNKKHTQPRSCTTCNISPSQSGSLDSRVCHGEGWGCGTMIRDTTSKIRKRIWKAG